MAKYDDIEKAPGLKDSLVDELQKNRKQQRRLKADIESERRAAEGKEYWKKVDEAGSKLLESGFQGYQDWALAMNALAIAFKTINEAQRVDPINPLGIFFTKDQQRALWDQGVMGVSLGALEGKLERAWIANVEKDALPRIDYSVKIGEDGFLNYQATKDGKPFSSEEHQFFYDVGITAWAKLQGFALEPDANNPKNIKVVDEKTGKPIPQKQFHEAAQDPEKGLQLFLSGKFDIDMKPSHGIK